MKNTHDSIFQSTKSCNTHKMLRSSITNLLHNPNSDIILKSKWVCSRERERETYKEKVTWIWKRELRKLAAWLLWEFGLFQHMLLCFPEEERPNRISRFPLTVSCYPRSAGKGKISFYTLLFLVLSFMPLGFVKYFLSFPQFW